MNINKAFVLRNIYNKYLLMPVHSNEAGNDLIYLNEIGAKIWELASIGLSEEEVIIQLMEEYDISEDSIEKQSINAFIEELCERKLLYR